jgi:oligopeptide transport system substrate-binding protein
MLKLWGTICLVALVFTGCGGAQSSDKNEGVSVNNGDGQVNVPKDQSEVSNVEQILNLEIGTEPDSLNLAKVSDTYSATIGAQIFEGLTTVEVENGREVVKPAIAESWETSEDMLTWTFKLREAKWSDGKSVSAQDFVYGITRILDPNTASPISSDIKFIRNAQAVAEGKLGLDSVGVKAIDEKTLEIQLEYPVPYFLSVSGTSPMYPVRADIVDKYGDAYGISAENLVFCGPFVLDEWVHNSKIMLSKNENYWDADSVKLEKVNFKIIDNTQAAIGEFENESLDFVGVGSADWIDELSKNDDYIKSQIALPRTQYMFFNQDKELFSNVNVRKAFSIALNREEISHDVFRDVEPPAYGWIPTCMNIEGENFRELAGNPIKEMLEENKDPKALLIKGMEELGLGNDPSSVEVELMCVAYNKTFNEYLQQHFTNALGVNVVLDPVEWPVFQERNRGLDYQFAFKSYGAGYDDPSAMMDLWITGTKTVPTAWSNHRYDELMIEASKTTDPEVRKKNLVEAEKILIKEDATLAPISYSQYTEFSHKYVKGVMEPSFTAIVLKHAYIEK